MSGSSSVKAFADAAGASGRHAKRKAPPPLSIRLTEDERARLHRDADELSLSAYIRQKLFGDTAAPRKPRYRRKQRRPAMDSKTVARLLGTLGQSELAASILAIALAARSGALPVTPELSAKLGAACDDIREMRVTLISALRVGPEEHP